MLPKIILTLLQAHVAWVYAPQLRALVPVNVGALNIFLLAVVIAVVRAAPTRSRKHRAALNEPVAPAPPRRGAGACPARAEVALERMTGVDRGSRPPIPEKEVT